MDRIEGRNPVFEALRAGRPIDAVYIAKGSSGRQIDRIIEEARKRGVELRFVPREEVESMALSEAPQGVVAVAEPWGYSELEDVFELAERKGEAPFVVILDRIQGPHNFGAILRSADAAGVHGVIIPKNRAVGITPVVAKASAGAVEYVKVVRVTNIVRTIGELKERGIWIAGASAGEGEYYYKTDLTGPIGLVVGSEGEGLGRLVAESCDFHICIPMAGNVQSLNVSVATGILLFDVLRQRMEKSERNTKAQGGIFDENK